MVNLSGNPIYLLKQDAEHVKGKNALKMNIEAIKAVAESIKTTIGPKGLNKMIVDNLGDVVVTGDGAKILEDMEFENPAAKMIADLSKTIQKNVGDGSSSTVIFIGELMAKTEELLSMDISAPIIYEGFTNALKQMKKILNSVAIEINPEEKSILHNAAKTALSSKGLNDVVSQFAEIIVETILDINEIRGGKIYVDLDNVQIIKKEGGGLNNTNLVKGIIVDKEVVNSTMPKIVKNCKIALIDGALEIIKTDYTAELQISNPDEIDAYLKKEELIIKDLISSISNSGANVVFCQKGIDEVAQHYLAKNNIMAIRRVKHSDMEKLSRATGAKIVTQIKNISDTDLGNAEMISEQKIGKDNMIFVENCVKAKSVTILIRGGTEQIVDDAERAIKNGLAVIKSLLKTPKIVGGAGSIEIEIRKQLIQYAQKVGGKQQIAIEQYADAFEIIPKTLVENSGRDPLDLITTLRSKVNYDKKQYIGFDIASASLVNVVDLGIIEPLEIKLQVFALATELASIFIRVDDYIRSSGKK